MNRKTHLVGGAVGAGLAVWQFCEKQGIQLDPSIALIATAGGLAGGRLPDLLEPARHPNHRQLGHSVSVGATLIALIPKLTDDEQCPQWLRDNAALRIFCISLIGGYLSHLLLDSMTKKGLPLLDRGTAVSFAKLLTP